MQAFLENPTVGRDAKKKLSFQCFLNKSTPTWLLIFFKAMADNGRLNDSLKVINSFEQLMKSITLKYKLE